METVQEFDRVQLIPLEYGVLTDVAADPSLAMPAWILRQYEHPLEETIFPLEYAFHLLGTFRGRTLVELGCGEGFNTVIFSALGARVIAMDRSHRNLGLTQQRLRANRVAENATLIRPDRDVIPVEDASVDRVFCGALLEYNDPLVLARQIRRILKPGGAAVFQSLAAPGPRSRISSKSARAIARAVGISGRSKEFWLTTSVLCRMGVDSFSPICRFSQRLDAAVLRRAPFTRALSSSLVWEARKES